MKREINSFKEYLLSKSSEDAKRPLVYPFFRKIFGKNFKVESDAEGADGYVEGKLLVELKTKYEDWLKGLYQGLHYQKLGLSFPNICVISHQFIGLWKLNDLPQKARDLAYEADSQISPSEMGRINANKTSKAETQEILKANSYLLYNIDFSGLFAKDIDTGIKGFIYALKHLDKARVQVNLKNFIDHIDLLKRFFDKPIDAIHCFYAIVGYWSVTSTVGKREGTNEMQVVDPSRDNMISEPINIKLKHQDVFKRFVEMRYVFTNEGSGFTYDNYFSQFDEVMSRLASEYAKQHGIIFTDHNLSKFAMWFVHARFEKNLSDKFFVFDPAGGSGNLITSLDWRGHLKHKIVSELWPDLLKVIERRMRVHEKHIGRYTIIPKTIDNKGLNFLNKNTAEYINELDRVLTEKNLKIDKPLAFLLNPPYKNTDENVAAREQVEAEYIIDPSILDLTGSDAGRERYLAFLGQIVNMAKYQHNQHPDFYPILMIFTPTSWLIPRPTYLPFRKKFDKHFKYMNGFIITSNEFFKIEGKWPLAFTIWQYNYNENGNRNRVKLWDYTYLKWDDLDSINWSARIGKINETIRKLIENSKQVTLDNSREEIRNSLPTVEFKGKKKLTQPRYNIYRNLLEDEKDKSVVSGFPFKDDRHKRIKAPHGFVDGIYVGFMDDLTPVRLRMDTCNRLSNEPDRVWFRLDNDFKGINRAKLFSGPSDNRSYCAYDLDSAQKTFTWFGMAKALGGRYPIWANQFDIWTPNIKEEHENYFFSLCFAFALAENRCVVTKFEAGNPVEGALEVFVDNPLSTNNPDSFWNTILDAHIVKRPVTPHKLVKAVKELYTYWAKAYCPQWIKRNVGLKDEPYFKYFDYEDFLTPNSGLIQIHKFADVNGKPDLLKRFEDISRKTKEVRDEIYRMLVEVFKYFD